MKTLPFFVVSALCIQMTFIAADAQELVVFSNIPGRDPSNQYRCRVKLQESNDWQAAFVLQTTSDPNITNEKNGYTEHMKGWSASWINFEMGNKPVVVEISTVSGEPISKAKVRPERKAAPAVIVNGKVYVTFHSSANINVDINGQMENQYTGMGYNGPPIHTLSLFGNPVIKDRPDKNGVRVTYLEPGRPVPNQDSWDVLYFAPGVHTIGTGFNLGSNKTFYIPGDAVVHGTMIFGEENIRIFGYGTFSGEKVARGTRSFGGGNKNGRVEGITLADPGFHSMITTGANTTLSNFKILAWRINGDGPSIGFDGQVENCFLRTQDDTFAYWRSGVKVRNTVIWNDWNGGSFFMARAEEGGEISDINVIYHRASWHYWTEGGRVFSFRNVSRPIKNFVFRNITIEDPMSAFPPFYFTGGGGGNVQNILLENVVQYAPSVSNLLDSKNGGKPRNTMTGGFKDITFKNCRYNGVWLRSFADGDFKVDNGPTNIKFIVDFSSIDTSIFYPLSVSNSNSKLMHVDASPFLRVNQQALTIQFNHKDIVSLELIDLLGKILKKGSVKTSVPIPLSLPPGIYIARIQSDEKIHVQRFLIKTGN